MSLQCACFLATLMYNFRINVLETVQVSPRNIPFLFFYDFCKLVIIRSVYMLLILVHLMIS